MNAINEPLYSLERIVNTYEKVTHSITLNLDRLLRKELIKIINKEPIIDVGSGTGALVEELNKLRPGMYIVMLEPIEGYIRILKNKFRSYNFEIVRAFAEYLPFRQASFEFLMSGFMLRDSMDLKSAIKNFKNISKNILILDFWKPDNCIVLFLELLYMYTFMPLLVAIHDPKNLKYYLTIPKTVLRVPKFKYLIKIFEKSEIQSVKKWFGGIFFLLYVKPIDLSK